jgi:hypothetical protein
MGIKAQVSIAHKLGFTSHQNAVPLLRELILHNESEETFQDLTLHLRTAPAVLEEKMEYRPPASRYFTGYQGSGCQT